MALALIDDLQPYHAANPLDHPLCIVHDMGRFDKHRELAIVGYVFGLHGSPYLSHYIRPDSGPIPPPIAREIEKNMKLTPSIAFVKFGRRENQRVIPALEELETFIRGVVSKFEDELRKC